MGFSPFGPSYATTLADAYLVSAAIYGETVPRYTMLNTGILPTLGTLQLSAVALPAGVAVGHLQYANSAAASAPSHWWFALFDSNRNMLAVTADQTTAAWGGNTFQSLPIAVTAAGPATDFITTYAGLYYIGVLFAGTTAPTLIGGGHAGAAIVSQAPILCGTSTPSLTTPPAFPFQAAAITPTSNVIWAAAAQ